MYGCGRCACVVDPFPAPCALPERSTQLTNGNSLFEPRFTYAASHWSVNNDGRDLGLDLQAAMFVSYVCSDGLVLVQAVFDPVQDQRTADMSFWYRFWRAAI